MTTVAAAVALLTEVAETAEEGLSSEEHWRAIGVGVGVFATFMLVLLLVTRLNRHR